MIEYNHYPAIDANDNLTFITIASGPVIIKDNKVLLVKEGEDKFWKFPGGRLRDDNSMVQNAIREVKEELNLEIEVISDPYVITIEREYQVNDDGQKYKEYLILVHYLAVIKSGDIKLGENVKEYNWFLIDSLPEDCAQNIAISVNHFKNQVD